MRLLIQHMLLAFSSARTHCWCAFSLLSTRTGKSFPAKLLANQLVLRLYCCKGLLRPSHRTLLLPLLNFTKVLSAHFSNLPRYFWMAILSSRILTSPSNLMLFTTFTRVHTVQLFLQVIDKDKDNRIDTQETPLVSTFKVDFEVLSSILWGQWFTQLVNIHPKRTFCFFSRPCFQCTWEYLSMFAVIFLKLWFVWLWLECGLINATIIES